MNQEARRDPINDGRKNEKKRGNHSTESIRPVRYAKGIYFGHGSVKRAATFCKRQRRARQSDYSGLFRSPCERFVEPCFATICCVSMDDSALCSLVDCRDYQTNLILAGHLRR